MKFTLTLPLFMYSYLSGMSVNSRGEPYTLRKAGPNVGRNPGGLQRNYPT